MTEETCPMLGPVLVARQIDGLAVEIHRCHHFQKSCTAQDHKIHVPGGMMQACESCSAKAAMMQKSRPMTTWERVTTAAKVIASTAVTGMADDATIEKRLAICQACPQFDNNGCKLCGCAVVRERNLINKLAHITSVCADKANPRW